MLSALNTDELCGQNPFVLTTRWFTAVSLETVPDLQVPRAIGSIPWWCLSCGKRLVCVCVCVHLCSGHVCMVVLFITYTHHSQLKHGITRIVIRSKSNGYCVKQN